MATTHECGTRQQQGTNEVKRGRQYYVLLQVEFGPCRWKLTTQMNAQECSSICFSNPHKEGRDN